MICSDGVCVWFLSFWRFLLKKKIKKGLKSNKSLTLPSLISKWWEWWWWCRWWYMAELHIKVALCLVTCSSRSVRSQFLCNERIFTSSAFRFSVSSSSRNESTWTWPRSFFNSEAKSASVGSCCCFGDDDDRPRLDVRWLATTWGGGGVALTWLCGRVAGAGVWTV